MQQEARNPESRAENLDALLAGYFQAEVPSPWPVFDAPARTLPFRPAGATVSRWTSRLALVAAVVLLLLGAWMLPGPSRSVPADRPGVLPGMGEGTAAGRDGLEKGATPAKSGPVHVQKGNSTRNLRR